MDLSCKMNAVSAYAEWEKELHLDAGTVVLAAQILQYGVLTHALLAGILAAGSKAAAGLGIDGTGQLALDDLDLLVAHGQIGHRDSGQQSLV